MLGEKCSSGCPTRNHISYGECLRLKGARPIAFGETNLTSAKRWSAELQAYRDAKAEGIQPTGTTHREIDLAKKNADLAGNASGTITVGTD